MLEQTGAVPVHAELDVALGAEGGVAGDGDTEGPAELEKALLGQVGVELNLKHLRLDACVAEKVDEQRALEVTVKSVRIRPARNAQLQGIYLTPMFLATPSSASSSSALQVSEIGTLAARCLSKRVMRR